MTKAELELANDVSVRVSNVFVAPGVDVQALRADASRIGVRFTLPSGGAGAGTGLALGIQVAGSVHVMVAVGGGNLTAVVNDATDPGLARYEWWVSNQMGANVTFGIVEYLLQRPSGSQL